MMPPGEVLDVVRALRPTSASLGLGLENHASDRPAKGFGLLFDWSIQVRMPFSSAWTDQ
jgi:hypothetical protein